MELKIFSVHALASNDEIEEINKFLRSHRILQMDKTFSSEGGYWSILVTYQEQGASASSGGTDVHRRQKVDYKELLSPEAYLRFEYMRNIRSELARKEGLAAFLIFSDRELARMAELEDVSIDSLNALEGIDDKKRQKYGRYFLTSVGIDETCG